jgi:hypothetical protein
MATAAPITTESILQEDGAAAALGKFASEVQAGEGETRKYIAGAEPDAIWTFRDLRDAVFEAAEGKLRKTAVTVALMSLDKAGVVQIDYAHSTVVVSS